MTYNRKHNEIFFVVDNFDSLLLTLDLNHVEDHGDTWYDWCQSVTREIVRIRDGC